MTDLNKTVFVFEPLIPIVRHIHNAGQQIFVAGFQTLMGGREHHVYHFRDRPDYDDFNDGFTANLRAFQNVMSHDYVTPRQARIATSLVRWLGTQMGERFLERADERLAELHHARAFQRMTYDKQPAIAVADAAAKALAESQPPKRYAECLLAEWTQTNLGDNKIRNHLCLEQPQTEQQAMMDATYGRRTLDDSETMGSVLGWLGDKGLIHLQKWRARHQRARTWAQRRSHALRL